MKSSPIPKIAPFAEEDIDLALDPHAENDPEYVDELLGAAGPASDDALRADLLKSRDTAPTASIRA